VRHGALPVVWCTRQARCRKVDLHILTPARRAALPTSPAACPPAFCRLPASTECGRSAQSAHSVDGRNFLPSTRLVPHARCRTAALTTLQAPVHNLHRRPATARAVRATRATRSSARSGHTRAA
jgi:hypothetical protein